MSITLCLYKTRILWFKRMDNKSKTNYVRVFVYIYNKCDGIKVF